MSAEAHISMEKVKYFHKRTGFSKILEKLAKLLIADSVKVVQHHTRLISAGTSRWGAQVCAGWAAESNHTAGIFEKTAIQPLKLISCMVPDKQT